MNATGGGDTPNKSSGGGSNSDDGGAGAMPKASKSVSDFAAAGYKHGQTVKNRLNAGGTPGKK